MKELKVIFEEINKRRAAIEALPVSEQRSAIREANLSELRSMGYITSEEEAEYSKPLDSLPENRKDLIVAYYCLGVEPTSSLDWRTKIQTYVNSYNLPSKGYGEERSVKDILGEEGAETFIQGARNIFAETRLLAAETFVDSRRGRVRAKLYKQLRNSIANALLNYSRPLPDGELDTLPYLADMMEENGYKWDREPLSDEDKAALETATAYYLDLMEIGFLNGKLEDAYKRYGDWIDSESKEPFMYESELDEVISEYDIFYMYFTNLMRESYAAESATSLTELLAHFQAINDNIRLFAEACNKSETTKVKFSDPENLDFFLIGERTLRNTKFNYLIEE